MLEIHSGMLQMFPWQWFMNFAAESDGLRSDCGFQPNWFLLLFGALLAQDVSHSKTDILFRNTGIQDVAGFNYIHK